MVTVALCSLQIGIHLCH